MSTTAPPATLTPADEALLAALDPDNDQRCVYPLRGPLDARCGAPAVEIVVCPECGIEKPCCAPHAAELHDAFRLIADDRLRCSRCGLEMTAAAWGHLLHPIGGAW